MVNLQLNVTLLANSYTIFFTGNGDRPQVLVGVKRKDLLITGHKFLGILAIFTEKFSSAVYNYGLIKVLECISVV